MKTRLLFISLLFLGLLESCQVTVISTPEPVINLQEQLQSYELWNVDINATQGDGVIPFLQRAFTVSFNPDGLYANNNLVGIGSIGNGFGIKIGDYFINNDILTINHIIDGNISLQIIPISDNVIEIYDAFTDTSYKLIGYQRDEFDYDALFYDNIEYFLQEYETWQKIFTSDSGTLNAFDNENYIRFIPEDQNIFQSSQSKLGTNIDNIFWDFSGSYEVFDVVDNPSVKVLTLNYDLFDGETFDLTVINDSEIEMYQESSGTTYRFKGLNNIQYLKGLNQQKSRYRFKVRRGKKHK